MFKSLLPSMLFFCGCFITNLSAQTIKTPLGQDIDVQEINTFLEQQMKDTGTPGISMVVINNGEVVFEAYKGYSTPNEKVTHSTIFEGASLSKPLFAFFVMRLSEKGLLNLDKPLYQYLPYEDIAYDERYKKMTARMVLSHQTGFPNWRTDSPGDKLFLDFEPGTAFQYSGEGYQYLALVLQHLTKTDAIGLQELFHQEINKPLGLGATQFIQDTENLKNKALAFKNGVWLGPRDFGKAQFGAAYGIHSNARDYANWVIALMNYEGLSEASYKTLFEPQVEMPEDNENRNFGITHMTMGFYTGVFPFGEIYGHGGNNDKKFTSLFFYAPSTKWGMVLFTNAGFGEQMGINFLQFMVTPKQ